MKLLAKFIHGSHLYKLNTKDSDQDFKGVYMPCLKDMCLGKVKDTVDFSTNKTSDKNTSDDVDYEVYSIQKFVKLLCKGEMVTFDMLFAPEESVTYYDEFGAMITSELAEEINHPVHQLRHKYAEMFVHSDMKAYLGYCRRQAAKYGIKGSRLASLFEVEKSIPALYYANSSVRLSEVKDLLPENEFLKKEEDHYELLGKKHQWTTHLSEFGIRLRAEIDRYGNRAKLAEQNEGIDWKAVSHAFRAGYQIEGMLRTGKMNVVLRHDIRDFIIRVKTGQEDWGDVKNHLEVLMGKTEQLASVNPIGLKQKPDTESIEEMLFQIIAEYHQHNKEFNNVKS